MIGIRAAVARAGVGVGVAVLGLSDTQVWLQLRRRAHLPHAAVRVLARQSVRRAAPTLDWRHEGAASAHLALTATHRHTHSLGIRKQDTHALTLYH